MEKEFSRGCAFIFEGETEKVFYISFLEYLCKKHSANLERVEELDSAPNIEYNLKKADETILFKFHVVNTVTQMPRAGTWFNTQCHDKYKGKLEWNVFLCYDTDDYTEDVSKFQEGDWDVLRKSLKKAKDVIDVAASADIEDIMLLDKEGICRYLGCDDFDEPRGRKGKVKMKNLFRDHQMVYHEGKRAKELIDSLDMEVLIEKNFVPLGIIEEILFN